MTEPSGRREEVLRQAGELFAAKSIAGTTVRDIGDAAAMLPGSLYHHFRSKDAIVRELLERYMVAIREDLEGVLSSAPDTLSAIRGLVRQTLTLIAEHPHVTSMYRSDHQYLREHDLLQPVEETTSKVRSLWMETIEAGVADGTLRDDVPTDVIYQTMRDTLWATHRWPTRENYSTDELADLLVRILLDGSARRAGTPSDA
ncbi:TetR/AcrR family transcriptional regulator [Nocardioides sp. W7]|uniref:TetR/AcrR family transcriptional regulator n=1 Tax=Nocardioides sp. W7 TaxID=2931390 RepID=UPI001FD37182|nr:TetR/AcrR family transcriptional regulator [Nocardioides sp. W7]